MTTLTAQQTQGFVPSEYQQAIFDALEENVSDLQVNAVAGSGKTTTLIQALNRIPYETLNSTLLCAFNKEIQRALEQRAPQGVAVKTLHAIGFATVCFHMQKATGRKFNPSVDDRKYRKLIESYWIGQDYRGDRDPAGDDEMEMFKLIHFVRVTLTNPNDQAAILEMAAEREVELSKPERQVAAVAPILAAGQDMTGSAVKGFAFERDVNSIDFDDMVWLPFVLDASPRKFRLVMVDEAQDLNAAQLDLVLKCRADGGRMVFVGDPHQAIYAFCGADADAWKKIHLKTGARQLPLSVCYRCPKAVIDLAQTIIPQIEARPGAAHGVVETIKSDSFRAMVTNRDMILCRLNAPLISTCFKLIAEGKPAKVRGRDIGAQLVKLIDQVEKLEGFAFQYFLAYTDKFREMQERVLQQRKDAEAQLLSLGDRIESIQAVYLNVATNGGRTVGDLRAKIESLFSDHENGHILLSSIHKAKGLEAERVFLLRPDKLPHPMAKSDAAREQESNLRYVAYTRAMAELYIVTPDPEDR
jgi:DNA helicase-2/ATP-dependent DNA helicase PcrA